MWAVGQLCRVRHNEVTGDTTEAWVSFAAWSDAPLTITFTFADMLGANLHRINRLVPETAEITQPKAVAQNGTGRGATFSEPSRSCRFSEDGQLCRARHYTPYAEYRGTPLLP
jgi:hypothetical protein